MSESGTIILPPLATREERAAYLRVLRATNDINLHQVANAANVRRETLCKCLSGKLDLPREYAEALLLAFGAPQREINRFVTALDISRYTRKQSDQKSRPEDMLARFGTLVRDVEAFDFAREDASYALAASARAMNLLIFDGLPDAAVLLATKVAQDLREAEKPGHRLAASQASLVLSSAAQVRRQSGLAYRHVEQAARFLKGREHLQVFEISNTAYLNHLAGQLDNPTAALQYYETQHQNFTTRYWRTDDISFISSPTDVRVSGILHRDALRGYISLYRSDPSCSDALRAHVEQLERANDHESDLWVRHLHYFVVARAYAALGDSSQATVAQDAMLGECVTLPRVSVARVEQVRGEILIAEHRDSEAVEALTCAAQQYQACGMETERQYLRQQIKHIQESSHGHVFSA